MDVKAYAAPAAGERLVPHTITRREVGPDDILIEIRFAGICHSDIHQAREEWGGALFPMVPGHEIAGVVTEVGSDVTKFTVGDHAGVGCFVDSCGTCANCQRGLENYCIPGANWTYNSRLKDGSPTFGGYSTHLVVKADYALQIPKSLPLDVAAPLLCAGITPYSPLRTWNAGPGVRVGIMGLGGLGHMGVKFASALGADVTLITHSAGKAEDGLRLGAHQVLVSSDETAMKQARGSLDLIVNTVSAPIALGRYLELLDTDGTMCVVGLPEMPLSISAFELTGQRRRVAGSNIGGLRETQEMLDFCGERGIGSDVEVIDVKDVNAAWDRVVASDVRYRFVIDNATL